MQSAGSPLVSIITPVFNAERFIARCISSVQGQNYRNWELLIADDGSTDKTASVVANFASDPRVRYFQLPHRGLTKLSETYNHALAHASGDLIAILEGDDFWPPDKLDAQVPAFDDPDVMLSWGRAFTVDDDDRELRWWRQPAESRGAARMQLATLFKLLARKNVLTPAATVMTRRSALAQIGGFQQAPGTVFVDLPTWLYLCAAAEGCAIYLPRCLAYYRVHGQQTSQKRNYEMRYQHHEIVQAAIKDLPVAILDRLQWSLSDEHAALATASLTRGVASLNARERLTAFKHFRTTFARSRVGREKLGAILGMMSAFSGLNLFAAVERVETRLRGESLHAL
jgi:glycosyltransferase involved in cell wall biosynthesis